MKGNKPTLGTVSAFERPKTGVNQSVVHQDQFALVRFVAILKRALEGSFGRVSGHAVAVQVDLQGKHPLLNQLKMIKKLKKLPRGCTFCRKGHMQTIQTGCKKKIKELKNFPSINKTF